RRRGLARSPHRRQRGAVRRGAGGGTRRRGPGGRGDRARRHSLESEDIMNKAIAGWSLAAVVVLALLATASPAEAQKRFVTLEGRVQWIAGQKLMLQPDLGTAINIDLVQVPMDEYRTLTEGDRVLVGGFVAPDNRKVYGTWVRRDTRWEKPF